MTKEMVLTNPNESSNEFGVFRVKFNRKDRKYFPGEEVRCKWFISFSLPQQIRSLSVEYVGIVRTQWTEERCCAKSYSGNERLFKYLVNVIGSRDGDALDLAAGSFIHETKFRLPLRLPPSFSADFGSVIYQVVIQVENRLHRASHTEEFFVQPRFDLNDKLYLHLPTNEWHHKGFWRRNVRLTNVLQSRAFIPGETIQLLVDIGSRSATTVIRAFTVQLLETLTFISYNPSRHMRELKRVLWFKDMTDIKGEDAAERLGNSVIEISVYLDPEMSFKIINNCPLINSEYFIVTKATVDGRFFPRTVTNKTKVLIGTVPFNKSVMEESIDEKLTPLEVQTTALAALGQLPRNHWTTNIADLSKFLDGNENSLDVPFTLERQESVSTTASERTVTAEERRKIFKESKNDPANLVKATFKI